MENEALKRVSKRRELTIKEIEKYEKSFREIKDYVNDFKTKVRTLQADHISKINDLRSELNETLQPMLEKIESYEGKMNRQISEFTNLACEALDVLRKDVDEIRKD